MPSEMMIKAALKRTEPALRGRPRLPAPALEPLEGDSTDPIDRQVYNAIRRSLMSGAILPGSRLSSRSIASGLGVSAMPVREALKRLDADGVLHSSAKSAFVVHDLAAGEYREILSVRIPLEDLLVEAAADAIAPPEIDRASWHLERMKTSKDWRHVLHHNYKMHFLIYAAAGMPYALSIVENIWLRVGPALHMVGNRMPMAAATMHLDDLIEALRRKDSAAAKTALNQDILMNAEVLLAQLEKREAERNQRAA